jgi:hypothetical protein
VQIPLAWYVTAMGAISSCACVAVLAPCLTGCTGTLLTERAERAASTNDFAMAVAYDAHFVGEHTAETDAQRAAHALGYVQQELARLGATSRNPDEEIAKVRSLLAWARAQEKALALTIEPRIRARIGELAHARWERVRALVQSGHIDDAVVLGRALLADAAATAEQNELKTLETKARSVHQAAAIALAGGERHEGAVMLHERLARQMGGSPTAAGERASVVAIRRAGMAPIVEATDAGACAPALDRLKALLPSGGDTPVHFTFRFSLCQERLVTSRSEDWREVPVQEESLQTVSDLVPRQVCQDRQGSCSNVVGELNDRGYRSSHVECNHASVCSMELESVARTERVRRTRYVQERYVVHHLRKEIDYSAVISTDIDGERLAFDVEKSTAKSNDLVHADTPPDASVAAKQAEAQVVDGLGAATRGLASFARQKQADRLREEAKAALAAGDPGQAEALYVESSLVTAKVVPELLVAGVSSAQLEAAIVNRPFEMQDNAGIPPVLPTIPESEILEDAHERTDARTLSATARAGYIAAVMGGVSRYAAATPADSTTGGFVGVIVTGAEQLGTPVTSAGGAFHMFGNFDGGTSTFDMSFDIGAGLKLGPVYLLPVGGLAFGTSTHASPSDKEFRPNAALRATALDAVYGGQLSVALPYPVNVTLHAQLVRTAPVQLDDFKQFTTRLQGTLSYGVSKELQVSFFARYWELDTASVGPLQFFGGNGHDHRLMTVGLGIAGGREQGFISQFFKKNGS